MHRPGSHMRSLSPPVVSSAGFSLSPSLWNPMHQHPPQTPLLASTRRAKSSQVSGDSGRVLTLPAIGCHRFIMPTLGRDWRV